MDQDSRTAYRVLAAAFVLGFFVFFSLFAVSPMLPIILKEFSLSFSTGGLLFSIPIGLLVLTSFIAGALCDKIGIKRTAGIGAVLLAIGSPARALSSDFTTLAFFTAFLGASYGFLLPTFTKMASGWFPPQSLGKVTGIYINGFYLGGAFGISATIPFIFPLISSWRGTVLITGVLSIVSAALWWFLAKEPPKHEDSKVKVARMGRSAWLTWTAIALAVIMTIENIHFYALGAWLPTFLSEKGADTSTGGLIASLLLYAAIPANFVLPILSDRLRKRKPIIWIGGIVNAIAFIILAPTPLFFQPLVVSILGFTLICFFVMIFVIAAEAIDYSALGQATGFIVALGFVGGIIGPYVAGLVRDLTGSFAILFMFEAAMSILVAVLAFTLPETGTRALKNQGV